MSIGSPTSITFRVITDTAELFTLEAEWADLWAADPSATIFQSPDWLLTWIQVYWEQGWQLYTLAGYEQGRLRVLAPMYIQPGRVFRQPTIGFPLGQGEEEEKEVASEYLDFLVTPGLEAVAYSTLADWITKLDVDMIRWRAARMNGHAWNVFSKLENCRSQSGVSYRVDSKSWTMETLGRSTRARWRRIQNTLKKRHSEFLWVHGHEQESLWPNLSDLHQTYWQNKGKLGAFIAEEFSTFHRTFRKATKNNASCMSCLLIDGSIVAINYYLISKETLFYYQSGWNLDHGKLSPGLALHLWSIKNNPTRYYDFMLGASDGSYKKRFGCEELSMIEFYQVRRRLPLLLSFLYRRLIGVGRFMARLR